MTVYLWIDFESIKYSSFFFLFAGFLYIFVRLLYILNDNNIVILSVELCFYQHFIWLYSCHVCVLYFFVWTFFIIMWCLRKRLFYVSITVFFQNFELLLFFSILDILKKKITFFEMNWILNMKSFLKWNSTFLCVNYL